MPSDITRHNDRNGADSDPAGSGKRLWDCCSSSALATSGRYRPYFALHALMWYA